MAVALKYRNVNVVFDGSSVDANYGDDASLSLNVNAFTTALSATCASIGFNTKSIAISGGLAVATGVAVWLMKQKWPWIDIEDTKAKDKLAVSFPKDRESEFNEIMKKKMQEHLQEAFANPEESVRKILEAAGEQWNQQQINEIVEKLKGCHLKSVSSEQLPGIPDGVVGEVIGRSANVSKTQHNVKALGTTLKNKLLILKLRDGLYLVMGLKDKNVVGKIIDGKYEETAHGGVNMVLGGASDEVAKEAVNAVAGNLLPVAVAFGDYSKRFKSEFEKDDTIYDLKAALKEKKGKIYTIRDSKTKEVLEDEVSFRDIDPSIRTNLLAVE